jgi:hypothetical protein
MPERRHAPDDSTKRIAADSADEMDRSVSGGTAFMDVMPGSLVLLVGAIAVAWTCQMLAVSSCRRRLPELWGRCGKPGYFLPGTPGRIDGHRRLLWKEPLTRVEDRAVARWIRGYRYAILVVVLVLLWLALASVIRVS